MRAPHTKNVDERRPESWVKKATLAAMLDISDMSVELYLGKLIPADAFRGEGLTLEFHGRSIITAWAIKNFAKVAASVPGSGVDEMLVEGDSPALERYRNARAAMSELDLAERRGELVNLIEFRDVHQRAARVLRKTGEQLQRKCGHEAWEIFDEGLVAAARGIDGYFQARES